MNWGVSDVQIKLVCADISLGISKVTFNRAPQVEKLERAKVRFAYKVVKTKMTLHKHFQIFSEKFSDFHLMMSGQKTGSKQAKYTILWVKQYCIWFTRPRFGHHYTVKRDQT